MTGGAATGGVDPARAGLVHTPHAHAVADALVAGGAFTVNLGAPREHWFRWKSGIVAPFGCDCRRLNADPAARKLIDHALTDGVAREFPDADYIVGVAHAGIPWAKTVADRLELPLAYVRAEPRAPGGRLVECAPARATHAVLIEDVVASGESARRAIHALLAETPLALAGVHSIANWNFPEMRDVLRRWRVRALVSHADVLDAAMAAGLIDGDGRARLAHFYADPRHNSWPDVDPPPR